MNKQMMSLVLLTVGIGIGTAFFQGLEGEVVQATKEPGSIEVQDDSGALVSLKHPADGVVAMTATDSELLLALGIEPKGVVTSKDLPAEVQEKLKKLNNVNSAMSPGVEKIVQTQADLALGVNMPFQTASKHILEENGIITYYHSSANYQSIMNHILAVGKLVGKNAEAEALVNKYNSMLKTIQERHQGEAKKRILIVFGTPVSYQLATSNTYVGDIFKRLGAENVADVYIPKDADGKPSEDFLSGFIPLNLETMSVLDCDEVYLITHGSTGDEVKVFKKAFRTPAWENVPAMRNGHVQVLPSNLFSTIPTARMDQVLLKAEEVLYGQK